METSAFDQPHERWTVYRVARSTYFVVLIVTAWFVSGPIEVVAANHPAPPSTVLIAVAGVVVVGGYLVPPRGLTIGDWKFRWLVPTVVVVALGPVMLGVEAGLNDRAAGGTLYSYCAYGAVSEAQLDGCMEHVNVRHIGGLGTDAARFATASLTRCLADAGPFCAQALAGQNELADQPPPGQ